MTVMGILLADILLFVGGVLVGVFVKPVYTWVRDALAWVKAKIAAL